MTGSASRFRTLYFYIAYTGFFIVLGACGYYMSFRMEHIDRPAPPAHSFVTDLTYYDMPRMRIEFGGGAQGSVSLDLSLEVAKKDVIAVEGSQPHIADRLNGFFLHISPDDFKNAQELPWLRQQMLLQVNNAAAVPVHDLLLRQMIVM